MENNRSKNPELIRKACDGDPEAFEELIKMHSPRIYGIAYQVTGNSEDAQDVVQEIFIRLHRSLRKYDERVLFTTWLYRITMNMAIDWRRKKQSERKMRLEHGRRIFEGSGTKSPDESRGERIQGTIEMISRDLPDMQRRVFVLRDLQDFSVEEITEILGCKKSTVRVHLARARMKIREIILEKYPDLVDMYGKREIT